MIRLPRHLLRQEVQIERLVGHTAYGPKYDQPKTVRCRIETGNRKVTSRTGEEVVSTATAFFEPDVALGPGDRLTWDGRTYTVEEARVMVGPTGQPVYVEAILR